MRDDSIVNKFVSPMGGDDDEQSSLRQSSFAAPKTPKSILKKVDYSSMRDTNEMMAAKTVKPMNARDQRVSQVKAALR